MKDKIKLLESARVKLKEEFIGIDSIIDSLISKVTPWFLAPDLLERPIVISLWGLTGTGKTSVIRRLVNLLGLAKDSLYVDCGEIHQDSSDSLGKKISDYFSQDDGAISSTDLDPYTNFEDLEKEGIKKESLKNIKHNCVFIFDEFQYTRTIDEIGHEIDKPSDRCIWSLMDNGIINLIERRSWDLTCYLIFIDLLKDINNCYHGLILENGNFPESFSPTLRESYAELIYDNYQDRDLLDTNTKIFPVLPKSKISYLRKKLNHISGGLGNRAIEKIKSQKSLGGVIEILDNFMSILSIPQTWNCSKSLVFVIGNLDDAFSVSKEISPDVDADIFYRITQETSIMDIKSALGGMYRPEQVGRFGNNMIIYPSLSKSSFKRILEVELSKITEKFQEVLGITLEFSPNYQNLLYSEGVYPTQGTRPLFTTIQAFTGSKYTEVLLGMTPETKKVIFDAPQGSFEKSTTEVTIEFQGNNGETLLKKSFIENLNLGALRDTNRCEKLFLHAIHEASHSVIYSLLTGKLPEAIIALTSEGGGVMYKSFQKSPSADSILEVNNEIMVSLAGYCAENIFFGKQYRTLGASKDLEEAWELFSEAVYNHGYKYPIVFASDLKITGTKAPGIDDELPLDIPGDPQNLKEWTYKKFWEFISQTNSLISENSEIIKKTALRLSEKRCLDKEEFSKILQEEGLLERVKKTEIDLRDHYKKIMKTL